MILVLVRHAESVENAAKYDGFYRDPRPYSGEVAHGLSRDVVGLTPRGFAQAQWLGAVLPGLTGPAPRLSTSTYRRAIDTAAVAFPVPTEGWPRVTALLDEQHYGDATYMTKRELYATYPAGADDRRSRKHLWTAPGGESLATDVVARARSFLASVDGDLEERDVVAFTHQTAIIAFRSVLEGTSLPDLLAEQKQRKTPNASILLYRIGNGHLELAAVIDPPP